MSDQNIPVSIVMSAISGYGFYYLKALWDEVPVEKAQLVGVVDPTPERSEHFAEIQKRGIPVFPSMEAFYEAGNSADLAVISSPIHFHVDQSIVALKNGSNVLCDKPLAASVEDVDRLIQARDESGKWLRVGYQWSYSKAIQSLKADIISGKYGKPLQAKTLCLWSRDDAYYARNSWAGRVTACEGAPVLDSPANNAMAHFLHNLLYLLGDATDQSVQLEEVSAELFRAYDIENYDTCVARLHVKGGAAILFYASHVTEGSSGPVFHIICEKGRIILDHPENEIVGQLDNGEVLYYGNPDDDNQFTKLFEAIDAVHQPLPVNCGLEAARMQTVAMTAMQQASPVVKPFPPSMIVRDEESGRRWADGLDTALLRMYRQGLMPLEAGYAWALKGK